MHTFLISNRLGRWLAVTLLALMSAPTAHAQLAGAKSIPGDYVSVAAAITDLNAQGVGTGGVTFNIAAGYTETAANLLITATGTAANPIVFQKAGAGANPTITAAAGVNANTSTTALDAIIKLRGSDYITFDGLTLVDPVANTAAAQMEFGFVLYRTSNTDGCQYVTIRNCAITLQKGNTGTGAATATGIFSAASTDAATAVLSATGATAAGQNSNNKFYGNTIQNVNTGIYLLGLADATPYANFDQNNDVGGSSAATGNNISNYGGTASTTAYGVRVNYQNGINTSYNTLSNAANGGVAGVSTLYGIFHQSGSVNGSFTASSNSITLNQAGNASSVYGVRSDVLGTGTVTENANIIAYGAATGNSGTMYGLYHNDVTGLLTITNNRFDNTGNTVASSGSVYFISANNSTLTYNVLNNTFTNFTKSVAGGTVYGYYNFGSPGSGTATLTGNTVSNITLTGATGFEGLDHRTGTSQRLVLTGNTISNVVAGTGTAYGLYAGYGDATSVISTNTISGLSGGTVYGINLTSGSTLTTERNTISGLSTTGASTAAHGIYISSGTTNNVQRNKIYGVSGTVATSTANGITIVGGTTNNVNNNLIGGLTAPISTGLAAVSGILISGGTTDNVSFNTIRLDGTSSGATFGTQGIYLNSTTAGLNLFDNIVVNLSTPVGTGGVATVIRRISGTAGTVPANLFGNNNLYYAGTPSATNLIYTEGTTTQTNARQTLAAYQAFLINREANSVTETNTPFASTNGADPTYLHLTPGAATQAESAGQPFGSVTIDFDGDVRNASTPDLGADEGNFQVLDVTGPVIAITGFTSSAANTTSRTLAVTITDASGIATGANAPRLYFRKNGAATYAVAAAPTVAGSVYTFTLDYSLIGGVVAGDLVQYYVAAQDALGNLSTNPTGGAGASPPGTTPPSFFYQYTVLSTLSGTYYVSATAATSPVPARTYATLTAAVAAYNTSDLGGAVTFLLLDPTYSTGETFPIAILNNADASATNTLTIKPSNATGTTTFAITGSTTTAILQLLASDYVTIDGSLGNTISATDPRPSRDLTVTNTNTGTASLVIQQFAQFTNDGATFNTIKNLVAVGTTTATTAATQYGIQLQAPSNASSANQYVNNTVQNCAVRGTQIGIGSIGGSITQKNQNTVITQNDLNTVGTGALTRAGILSFFDNNLQVTQNAIDGIAFAGTGDVIGISLGFGLSISNATFTGSEVTNATVSRNSIGTVRQTNTYSAAGIAVAAATSGTNLIANNFVSGVSSNGTSPDFGAGIFVGGGAGSTTRLLYNSVSMTGTQTGGDQPSFALAIGGSSPTVEIRDNALLNTQSTGNNGVVLGFAYAGTAGAYAGLTSSNNAFATGTGATFFVGQTGSLSPSATTRATLADLNAETGQDRPTTATSPAGTSLTLSGSPFVSNTDLHVAGTTPAGATLNGAATPIASVTTDIDGETRNATTPDIGADEFLSNLDIAVQALVSPVAANQCFTNAETVTASITNANTTTALNFATNPVTVTVTITGPGAAQTLTQVVNTGTLAAGASQNVTFVSTADLSAVGTYSVTVRTALVGDDNLANNNLAPVSITTAPARSAAFTLPTAPLCAGASTTLTPTLGTGATAGTFSVSPATGLVVNPTTGVVSATGSTAGTYTVTNTLAAGNGCAAVTATQTVTVAPQTTATFSYTGTTYCQTGANPTPAITGTAGGAFSATPSGLTLDPATGVITLSSSAPGAYTVTYAVSGTCPSSSTQSVTITAPQSAAFSYPAGSNCAGSTGSVTATLGSGAAAGTFSATPAGLSLDPATGAVNLSASAAGTYTVTNTLPAANGCAQVTSTASLTLNATPSTAFAYSGGTFCQTGTNPTPTVTGQTGGAFSATPAGLSLDPATGTINLAASNTGTYTVTYAVAGTCAASSSTPVTISTAPSAAFTFATGSSCAGSAGTLTPSFGAGSSAGTFAATPAGLSIDPSTGVVTLSTSTAGTYTITNSITASGGCAAATATQTLTLNAAPVATLAAGGPTTFCQGSSVTLTAPAGTGNTYQFFNGTTSLGAASATNTFTATAAGSYTVVVTNAATCQATSAATVVTVNPQTTATFAYTGSPFCQSSATNPAPTVTGTAGGTFTSTVGLAINATTGVVDLANSTPGTYVVTYTVSGPCGSSSTQSVTITAAPTATFSYGTTSTYCVSGTINPAVVLGTGSTAGTFSSTTGLTINASTGAITLSSSTPGTYTVTNTVAAANGCATATATTQVTITAAPTATFSYATATGCVGSTATATPTLGTGATAGTFSSTTGLTINTTTGVITLSSSTAGTYTVTNTVAATGGCAAATATATFTVNPRPATPTISAAYNGAVTTLTSSAATGNQFYFNGVAITGATNQTYVVNGTPASLGSYTVTTTNANGCVSLPSVPLVVTAAKTGLAGASLKLYPNPTPSGQVTLELTGYRSATQLTVLDALGRVVTQQLLPANAGTATHVLDLTGAATGVYLLRLSNADGVETRRLVRE